MSGGRTLGYGSADAAASCRCRTTSLKEPADFKLIGTPHRVSMPR
jgi:hypothetical protein